MSRTHQAIAGDDYMCQPDADGWHLLAQLIATPRWRWWRRARLRRRTIAAFAGVYVYVTVAASPPDTHAWIAPIRFGAP